MKPAAAWSLVVLTLLCRVQCQWVQFVVNDTSLKNVNTKGFFGSDSGIAESSSVNSSQHALHRNRRQLPPTQGRAEEGRCPLPPPMENGRYSPNYKICPPHISNPACKMVPGVLVPASWELFYSCDTGYILNSTETVSYCVDGQWSPSLPGCIAGKPCPPLRSLNVNVKCSFGDKVVSCEHSVTPGTIATPKCNQNYKPAYRHGYEQLTCLNDGYWDYPLIYCTPEQLCPPLKSPDMKMQCIFQDKAVPCYHHMKPGTIAIPECKYHYRPSTGNSNLTCLNSGTWDRPLFKCTAECGASNEVGDLSNRIIDGQEAVVGAFPWHAGLYYRQEIDGKVTWEQKCGGSLITDQFVLTAAHCVVGRDETNVRIALGKFYRSWDRYEVTEVKRNVTKIFYPPEFSKGTYIFDIALLLLNSKIEFNEFIMPACHGFLDGYQFIKNNNLFVVGWGKIDETQGGKVSETLLYNDVMVLSPNDCSDEVPSGLSIFEKFCTENNNSGVSIAQQGDSGGGLTSVVDGLHYIFGVVSNKLNNRTYFTNITWPYNMIWVEGEVRKHHSTFSWIGNEITMLTNGSRSCMLPGELASRKFCLLAEGCEDCDRNDTKCFIPAGSEAEKVRVVCSPGYRFRTPYRGGDVATCQSGGSWYPRIPECTNIAGERFVSGNPWSKVTWSEARDNCQAMGKQLAIIKTKDHQKQFKEAAEYHFRLTGTQPSNLWIGLRSEESFIWSDTRPALASFTNWLPGCETGARVEAVVGDDLTRQWPSEKPFKWNNVLKIKTNYYFCSGSSLQNNSDFQYTPGQPWKMVTWDNASENCKTQGKYLAIIKSKEHQELFEKAATKQFNETGTTPSNIWIGLRTVANFKWIDGSTKGAVGSGSSWLPGKPAYQLHRNCVAAVTGVELTTTKGKKENMYEWEDAICSVKNYYFCSEKSTKPS